MQQEIALDTILDKFRQDARNNRERGDLFERLIANYLLVDPQYDFEHVWLWDEWPHRWSVDTGVDIVARERGTGEYWAIQCKFYLPEHHLSQKDLDSFFNSSGRKFALDDRETSFSARLIVTTTDRISKHAENSFADQTIPTSRLSIADLYQAPIDWANVALSANPTIPLLPKRDPRSDQVQAINDIVKGLSDADRGKAIMACGTGKTFTSLKVVERMVPAGGRVLFLAPSISLVAQALREWSSHATSRFHAFIVCSDSKVGKDSEDFRAHDVAYPATTRPDKLATHAGAVSDDRRTIVFSTYQSISVVSQAQQMGMADFDLIICDEAHRTTGIDDGKNPVSEFVKVHEQHFVRAAKRLYMTATPRVYADSAKSKADDVNAAVYSMDDEAKYGKELHRISFGQAVQKELLTDYKVLIVAVDEQRMAALANNVNAAFGVSDRKAIDINFAVKVVGAWKGLSKRGLYVVDSEGEPEPLSEDTQPMSRALAFSSTIKASREITDTFSHVTKIYRDSRNNADELSNDDLVDCKFEHVDGSMNALKRLEALSWLKASPSDGECRILSNARCLSEGIDVPTLDSVVFFDTRDSIVDIVQAVGRVMRRADDKKYGYIILPVAIPWAKVEDYNHYVSTDNRFKAIWKVLKALRAHDERLVDEAVFRQRVIVASEPRSGDDGEERQSQGELDMEYPLLPIGDLSEAVYSAIPKKLGDREYWSSWASDIAKRADAIVKRIEELLETDPEASTAFDIFLKGLQDTLNPGVARSEAIDMLAQHILTLPVFQALFSDQAFPENNVVGKALEDMVAKLDRARIDSEITDLEQFYTAVRERVALAKSDKSKQEIIRGLYDTFFQTAFKDLAKRLGVVYTPIPIVDFIIHSADAALRKHFNQNLADRDVHILDPFAGTGTFIVRLIQSGLIDPDTLIQKYAHELHANEIVLLAYYISNINIETAYHAATGGHAPYNGMVLTDTFQISENNDLIDRVVLPENNARVEAQLSQPITVIMGNPPYRVAQDDTKYSDLDRHISTTYGEGVESQNINSLYNSYIRAFRWAANRIQSQGLVCFVTSGGWLDDNALAGLRKHFRNDFSDLYIFNLRGNQRTKGEESRREGGKVFGGGSRSPITISILVKHPDQRGPGKIHYRDIGDYLTAKEKFDILEKAKSIDGIDWETVEPNEHHDWINQRSSDFDALMPIAGKDGIFETYQNGVQTNRDTWVYNFNKERLIDNVKKTIAFYNGERERLQSRFNKMQGNAAEKTKEASNLVQSDDMSIKWTSSLLQSLVRDMQGEFKAERIVPSRYRPFSYQWLFYDKIFIHRYKERLWPTPDHDNLVIDIKVGDAGDHFFTLAANQTVALPPAGGNQCFPLYHYVRAEKSNADDLFGHSVENGYIRREAISDAALATFMAYYNDEQIDKPSIFYYVYGVLHSPIYIHKYRNNLKRELPRIPLAPDFWAFANSGRKLADLHINYEQASPYPLTEESNRLVLEDQDYVVKRMRFGTKADGTKDFSVLHYNEVITLRDIPLDAQRYVINGTTAIGWIIDQYRVSVDNDSGIRNDPNDWSDDPRYIIDLIRRIVTVSVETIRIVDALPEIDGDS